MANIICFSADPVSNGNTLNEREQKSSSLARDYVENFTIIGISKVFYGRLWERSYWGIVLLVVLGFLSYKIYGFHERYSKNEYRTEIRMLDVTNYSWPVIKICNTSLLKGEEASEADLYCYKNQTWREGRTRPCTMPEDYDVTITDGRSGRKKANKTNDYWYPTACMRLNISGTFFDDNPDKLYIGLEVGGAPRKNDFQITLEGDHIADYDVKYGSFEIGITETTSFSRLESPFKSNCSRGEGVNVFPGPYTREKCRDTLRFYNMLLQCGDVSDHLRPYVKQHYKRGWSWIGKRNERSIINCIGSYFKEAKFRKPTLSECPLSCQEMMYKSVGYQSKVYTRAEVSIVYQHKLGHITEVEELATYELEEFFSDLGSWLGLLSGMSFLSLVEIVAFVYTVIMKH